MSLIQGNLAKSAVSGFYNGVIEGSARFDNSGSRLQRTMGSGGSRTKWTASAWLKRAERTGQSFWLSSRNSEIINIGFQNDNFYMFLRGDGDKEWRSNAKYRDPSAWYHVVVAFDTTQSTASNRVKVYINGEQITSWSSQPTVSQNYTTAMCEAQGHCIGDQQNIYDSPFPGYMAEVILIDGQQLAPTSFGESKNGVWIPKAYSGSYGTNGFRLDFSQSLTADQSGNGNNWTAVNMGSTDLMLDTPENSFAVLNPNYQSIEWGNATLSEGNLKYVGSGQKPMAHSTFPSYSGKWYAEVYYTGGSDTTTWAIAEQKGGFDQANDSTSFANYQRTGIATAQSADGWVSFSITSGNAATYSTYSGSQGSSIAYSSGDILMIALDMDNNKVWYGVNGTWANSGDPAAGTGALFSGSSFAPTSAVMFGGSHYMGRDDRTYWNFGVNSTFNGNVTAGGNADGNGIGNFKYSVPSGFLALCNKNKAEVSMATNVDDRPEDYFNIVLWDANGSGAVDRSITGLGFQPDFVWSKTRDAGYHHALFDSLRGPSSHIATDRLEAQNTVNGGRLSSFDSDGFTWTANGSSAQWYNETGREYIAWAWKAGGAPTATNSAGSGNVPTSGSVLIDGANSTTALSGSLQINKMSVNTKAGFSIVQWTGAGGSAETIDHGLSQAPEMIITKGYTGGYVWSVYQENMPSSSGYYMQLNSTNARSIDDTMYKSTAATNSVFTVGSYNISSGIEYVAYCWHSVEGYSKIGVFDGNGSADGTFVNLGFKPAFILMRNRDIVTQWYMVDNKIGNNTGNKDPDYFLYPNQANQQDTPVGVDFLAGGFKVRTTGSGQNGNNNKMLYLAFAEDPFKYSEAK